MWALGGQGEIFFFFNFLCVLAILTGMREEEIAKELNGSRREEVQEKKNLKIFPN